MPSVKSLRDCFAFHPSNVKQINFNDVLRKMAKNKGNVLSNLWANFSKRRVNIVFYTYEVDKIGSHDVQGKMFKLAGIEIILSFSKFITGEIND